MFLGLWTLRFPSTSGAEAAAALRLFRGVTVSTSTLYREWQRIGMPRKLMKRYAETRDEQSRIDWFVNPPNLALPKHQRGVFGVDAA